MSLGVSIPKNIFSMSLGPPFIATYHCNIPLQHTTATYHCNIPLQHTVAKDHLVVEHLRSGRASLPKRNIHLNNVGLAIRSNAVDLWRSTAPCGWRSTAPQTCSRLITWLRNLCGFIRLGQRCPVTLQQKAVPLRWLVDRHQTRLLTHRSCVIDYAQTDYDEE